MNQLLPVACPHTEKSEEANFKNEMFSGLICLCLQLKIQSLGQIQYLWAKNIFLCNKLCHSNIPNSSPWKFMVKESLKMWLNQRFGMEKLYWTIRGALLCSYNTCPYNTEAWNTRDRHKYKAGILGMLSASSR